MAAISTANTLVTINDPLFPNALYNRSAYLRMTYAVAIAMDIENAVTIRPEDSNEIITAVIAPGPARSGNARGTTPVSSLTPLPPTKRHPPPVRTQ
jgi:hypothetical protein